MTKKKIAPVPNAPTVETADQKERRLTALSKMYRPGQTWQCKPPGEKEWHTLPAGFKPGFFLDTDYQLMEPVRNAFNSAPREVATVE